MNNTHNLKKMMLAIGLLTLGVASAQQISGDVAKQSDIVPGTTTTGGSVRIIDNRGTIKYLQTNNGITTLSNTTNDVTTTTWQLGGTLTNDTFIDVNGNVFGFDGLELITSEVPSTDATTESDHGTGTGYTILVRDEATGAVKKLLTSDLNLIESGQERFTATTGQTAYSLTGDPVLPSYDKIWVYRNGVKLIANVDYTVATSIVTLVPGGTAPNDWAVYAGDIIEVQFIR